MSGAASIGGIVAALEGARLTQQIQAAVAHKQIEALQVQGELALRLIQSASIDPEIGRNVDVTV